MQENENNHDTKTNATSCTSSCFEFLFAIFHPCWCRDNIVILLLGLDNAGKSTLISTIRKEERNDDIPTWGFDEKIWDTPKFRTSLYDLGGGKSIRGIWPHYYAEAYGAIFVVDGADGSRIWEASTELKNAMKHPQLAGKPFLIVANKLNEFNTALQYEELMGILGPFNISKQALIYCDCRLLNGRTIDKDLQLGLNWLLGSIKFRYNELRERVSFEFVKQKDEEQRSLLERQLRAKSFKEEKKAASTLHPIKLPNVENFESETHARMRTWIGLNGSKPVICTYEQRSDHGRSFEISTANFDKSLAPLIKKYEESSDEPTYTSTEIIEYFGDTLNETTKCDQVVPYLPGQPSLSAN